MSFNGDGPVPDWRARVRQIGKAAFIREEMERLGFWKPDAVRTEQAVAALAELRATQEELIALRAELAELDSAIADARDLPKMLAEIRRRRIERVRAAREERRQERARQQQQRRCEDQERRRRTPPFLGRGVSAGLRYEGGDPAGVAALGLPPLESAADVAAAIGIAPEELAWLTYHRGAAAVDHYHRFTIPKRTGGERVISSPKRRLRVAQRWLLDAILTRLEPHEAATAFRTGRSIVDNAALHAGRAVVVRVDLEAFFPSITFRRVKGLFESFGYSEGVATLLALLATEAPRVAATLDGERRFVAVGARQLPQGACTSPAITNLLCRKLDRRLSGAARVFGFAYSRYADDLVFSHSGPEAPVGSLLATLRRIITAEGFRVNEEKTAVMRPQHRQAVTGLVVNEVPRVSRRDLRRFRAFLHHCETEGIDTVSRRLGHSAHAYAAGYLSFLHMVSPEQEARIRRAHPWLERWQKG
jgi:retron-type reverse transcriptase